MNQPMRVPDSLRFLFECESFQSRRFEITVICDCFNKRNVTRCNSCLKKVQRSVDKVFLQLNVPEAKDLDVCLFGSQAEVAQGPGIPYRRPELWIRTPSGGYKIPVEVVVKILRIYDETWWDRLVRNWVTLVGAAEHSYNKNAEQHEFDWEDARTWTGTQLKLWQVLAGRLTTLDLRRGRHLGTRQGQWACLHFARFCKYANADTGCRCPEVHLKSFDAADWAALPSHIVTAWNKKAEQRMLAMLGRRLREDTTMKLFNILWWNLGESPAEWVRQTGYIFVPHLNDTGAAGMPIVCILLRAISAIPEDFLDDCWAERYVASVATQLERVDRGEYERAPSFWNEYFTRNEWKEDLKGSPAFSRPTNCYTAALYCEMDQENFTVEEFEYEDLIEEQDEEVSPGQSSDSLDDADAGMTPLTPTGRWASLPSWARM